MLAINHWTVIKLKWIDKIHVILQRLRFFNDVSRARDILLKRCKEKRNKQTNSASTIDTDYVDAAGALIFAVSGRP